eukprot:scaffold4345_cov148-Skeletonema_menzelii.AAC.3
MTSSTSNIDATTCGFSSPLASCTEACQSISNISLPSNELACLHPVSYFNLHNNHHHDGDDYETHHHSDHIAGSGSPVMYANHAPIMRGMGLTKCEYCGSSSVDRCQGVKEVHDHFNEYQQRMFGGQYDNGGNTNHANAAVEKDEENNFHNAAQQQQHRSTTNDNYPHHDNNNNNDAHSTSSTSTSSHPPRTCHRPKLFFLKKRPPFANSNDGWNLETQHRQHLFEPPSSMEGVGRGYGEVRGQLGDYCTVNYASPKFIHGSGGNGMMSMKKGYTIFQRSKSMPVRATGGFDTGRSLSPLQWVNGSEIKGVMNWFA